ncbi:MAG: hypothetical protein M5R36_19370 [Deltaproteobacteria bacterium]|nr:hypothetical protein [Deltaproteobacteria bacterium]
MDERFFIDRSLDLMNETAFFCINSEFHTGALNNVGGLRPKNPALDHDRIELDILRVDKRRQRPMNASARIAAAAVFNMSFSFSAPLLISPFARSQSSRKPMGSHFFIPAVFEIFSIIINRSVLIVQRSLVERSQAEICFGKAGIERERFFEGFFGALGVPRNLQSGAEIGVRNGIIPDRAPPPFSRNSRHHPAAGPSAARPRGLSRRPRSSDRLQQPV